MTNPQNKRYVTGESCGFDLDDMKCWEFVDDGGYTDVTFKNGTTCRFREDLRELIKASQLLPTLSAAQWGTLSNQPGPLTGMPST